MSMSAVSPQVSPAPPQHVQPALPSLMIKGPAAADRCIEEGFVASVFERAWGAHVTRFLPWLCSLQPQADAVPEAVLGLRAAARERLFCEQYLDEPLLAVPARLHGQVCERADIMELGNLAASSAGRGALLYLLATQAAHRAGVRYLLFAANRAVRLSILRSGFTPLVVGPADAGRLGSRAGEWGRYYDGNPVVMLGDMALTDRQARQRQGVPALLAHYDSAIAGLASVLSEVRQ
ncbi:thermostable hemolysin [Haliea atlantica]